MRDDVSEPQLREAIDIPFGPPPEEYLYRCPVCGEEARINEEIVDVTVGWLKFNGEYKGGMPTLPCPGCEGDTMAFVEKDG